MLFVGCGRKKRRNKRVTEKPGLTLFCWSNQDTTKAEAQPSLDAFTRNPLRLHVAKRDHELHPNDFSFIIIVCRRNSRF